MSEEAKQETVNDKSESASAEVNQEPVEVEAFTDESEAVEDLKSILSTDKDKKEETSEDDKSADQGKGKSEKNTEADTKDNQKEETTSENSFDDSAVITEEMTESIPTLKPLKGKSMKDLIVSYDNIVRHASKLTTELDKLKKASEKSSETTSNDSADVFSNLEIDFQDVDDQGRVTVKVGNRTVKISDPLVDPQQAIVDAIKLNIVPQQKTESKIENPSDVSNEADIEAAKTDITTKIKSGLGEIKLDPETAIAEFAKANPKARSDEYIVYYTNNPEAFINDVVNFHKKSQSQKTEKPQKDKGKEDNYNRVKENIKNSDTQEHSNEHGDRGNEKLTPDEEYVQRLNEVASDYYADDPYSKN